MLHDMLAIDVYTDGPNQGYQLQRAFKRSHTKADVLVSYRSQVYSLSQTFFTVLDMYLSEAFCVRSFPKTAENRQPLAIEKEKQDRA